MPDVGTLNITIESNAGKATGGLVKLADALTRVKTAVGTGIGLSKVAEEVTTLAKTIQDARGTSTIVKNLGTMFNAINQFSKLKNFTIDTEKIRSTAENMLKLAEAKERVDAATKSTAGVSDWRSSMNTIASDTKKAVVSVQDSINQYENIIKDFTEDSKGSGYLSRMAGMGVFATSMPRGSRSRGTTNSEGQISMDLDGTLGKIKETVSQMNVVDAVVTKVTEHVSTATNQFSSFFDSERMIEPYKKIADQMHEAEKTSLGYANAIGTILPKVNQHNSELMIEAGNARLAAMSEQALATAIAEAQGLLQRSRPAELLIQTEQIQSAEQFNIVLNETGDIVTSVLIPRFQEMYETWSMMAYEFGAFQMQAARLVGGDSPLLLGDGRTPGQLMLGDGTEAETFLSTWVQAGETFKTNWVDFTSDVAAQWRTMWSPDWILGGWQTPVSMSSFHLGQGDSPLLLGDGGVSPDEMLSTWIDTSEQWKQNWIVGEGYVSDAAGEAEQIAAKTQDAANEANTYNQNFQSAKDSIKGYYASLEDMFNGIRHGKVVENDLLPKWLHGEGTQNEQLYALKVAAQMFGMTLDEVREKIAGLIADEQAAEQVSGQLTGSTSVLAGAIDSLKQGYNTLKTDISEAGGALNYFKKGIEKMFPTLTGLLKRFKSMMIMRSLRYVIRELGKGFREGVQNVYQYSKAVGTSFAPSMDQAATALQQMKNSIGAAVAPVIQALIPVLQTVVNWVITGINYLNQFFALLNGQSTWTRALPEAAEAFEKNTKAAKGSSKAMKDLLADWDELNIIQSNSGSGGGSGTGKTAEEYKNMFEEVSRFDDGIKRLVRGIEDQFGDILGFVKKIGIAVLGWKLSNAFTGALGTIGALVGSSLVIGLTFDISTIFTKQFLATGEKGWLVGDLLATLLGGTLAKKMLGNVLGGSLAKLAIPLAFAVSAAATIKALIQDTDVSVLSEKSILSAITGGIEGGAAIGTALFSLGEYAAGTSAVAGIGGALFTFGVAIGLKAIATKLDVGELTPEVIGANFLSAGAIGGGLFITELALGGGVVSALTLGGGAAILALGALFAIEALISKEPAKVEWGEYKATKAEIEEFVNNKLYEEPPTATIKKINTVIDKLPEVKESLSSDISSVVGTIDALTVGILTTPDDLKSDIDQLISDFNNASEQYQNTLKVALSLAPVTGEGGKDKTSEILKNSSGRWSALNGIMADLGSQLADAYKIAYDARLQGNIDKAAEETIKEISEMMNRVTTAIATGQSKARAGNAIRMQIENLSKETLDGILESYKAQRNALIEELKNVRKESAEGVLAQQYAFEELAAYALKDANGNTGDATYQYYMKLAQQAKDDYETLLATLDKDVEEAADKLADSESMKKLREFMIGSITNTLNENDIDAALASAGYDADKLGEYLVKILSGGDTDKQRSEVQELFDSLLSDLVGEDNYETFKSAIESNVLSYGDLFSDEFISSIADRLGITGENRDAWNQYVSELLGKDVKTPGLDNTELDSSVKDAKSAIADLTAYISGKMSELTGQGFDVKAIFKGSVATLPVEQRATGGFVKSGDLVLANENGNFEMMGKMGNQPVVANNQQIVSGISQGVSQANGDVVGELRTLTNLMQKMLNKEFVARAIPGSGWGEHNARSNMAYEKVTG